MRFILLVYRSLSLLCLLQVSSAVIVISKLPGLSEKRIYLRCLNNVGIILVSIGRSIRYNVNESSKTKKAPQGRLKITVI
jgi:hypothetical protein